MVFMCICLNLLRVMLSLQSCLVRNDMFPLISLAKLDNFPQGKP